MKKQDYIDKISDWLDEENEKTFYIHGVFFYTEDSEEGEGDELEVYSVYKSLGAEVIFVSFWGSDDDMMLEDCTDYEISLIYNKIAEDNSWNPGMGTEALIDELGITKDMTCDQIYDKVHAYVRKPYDGQVSDVLFMDEANETTKDICEELGIEFVETK